MTYTLFGDIGGDSCLQEDRIAFPRFGGNAGGLDSLEENSDLEILIKYIILIIFETYLFKYCNWFELSVL